MTTRKPTQRKSLSQTKHDNATAMNYLARLSDKPLVEVPEVIYRKRTNNTAERDVSKQIQEVAKQFDNVKLWRNNRGQVMLDNGARIAYGVGPNGASDFIGYRRITITLDMVGHRIAQFLAIEAKRPGAKARPDQADFIEQVNEDGGRAGVATSAEETIKVLRK
jgi:hypothetical protein